MHKIAKPQDLQAELRRLLSYAGSDKPSRIKLAAELRGLADRVAGNPGDPKPKFRLGDKVLSTLNPKMLGEVSFIADYDEWLGQYRYKVLEPNGTRHHWNEGNMKKISEREYARKAKDTYYQR
jgi:hypothetical protein